MIILFSTNECNLSQNRQLFQDQNIFKILRLTFGQTGTDLNIINRFGHGCQMLDFHTNYPNLRKICWDILPTHNHYDYFTDIW
jgi:hypothetical protein